MEAARHPMHTRQRGDLSADVTGAEAARAHKAPPLFALRDLDRPPRALVSLFIEHGLLPPLNRVCPTCGGDHRLVMHEDESRTDRMRLRCSHCKGSFNPRHGTWLDHYDLSLRD